MAEKKYVECESLLKNKQWLALQDLDRARAKAIILDWPASDVAAVRRAYWIETDREAICSDCECRTFNWAAWSFDYCPFCGAKMDGGNK